MLRFLPVVMLIPFPILNSLNDCLEFGVHYSFLGTHILPVNGRTRLLFALNLQLNR